MADTVVIDAATQAEVCGPWNPGISSQLPWELLPLSTMFRPENVFTSIERARELRDLTGLDLYELVAFRPQRLVLHELLIRVTADLSVPDGPRVEDLGISFRRMTRTILEKHIAPHMDELAASFETLRAELAQIVEQRLDAVLCAAEGRSEPRAEPPARRPGLLRRLFGAGRTTDERAAERTRDAAADDGAQAAADRALQRVVWALLHRHGRVWGERSLIAALATDFACNDYGADAIGRWIEPYLAQAVREEGYRLLPAQAQPIVLNTKGASASGKSTLRPLQKALANEIGASWGDFALISPDIWRKQLLDYASLGAAFKYAGTLTGHELHIIDLKLDRYMARKAEARGMSHLLIDRFRFDSFAPDCDEPGKNLLTRFGHIVYLFFMITPPEATVERSWKRGLEVGRYKAVDDLLAHNVEAYSGMPRLFFTWAQRADKWVHYEFLDNSVASGARPRTVAFGWNGEMNVLDVKVMIDVERFKRLDIAAVRPDLLYRDPAALAPGHNVDFLQQCVRRLAAVNFADAGSGRVYLRMASGALDWVDADALRAAASDDEVRIALEAIAPGAFAAPPSCGTSPRYLSDVPGSQRAHTLGRWGELRP